MFVNACESTSTESEEEPIELDPSFQHESAPFFINQERLNDLVRDLYLSKEKVEILWSRLQQWNLLEPGTTISSFCSRNQNLAGYYASAENICYCKDISGLMSELGCEHNPADWRLFIDSSKITCQMLAWSLTPSQKSSPSHVHLPLIRAPSTLVLQRLLL